MRLVSWGTSLFMRSGCECRAVEYYGHIWICSHEFGSKVILIDGTSITAMAHHFVQEFCAQTIMHEIHCLLQRILHVGDVLPHSQGIIYWCLATIHDHHHHRMLLKRNCHLPGDDFIYEADSDNSPKFSD
jgi:hypothetical protein